MFGRRRFQLSYEKKAKSARQAVRDHVTQCQNEIGAENAALEVHAEWTYRSLTSLEEDAELKRQQLVSARAHAHALSCSLVHVYAAIPMFVTCMYINVHVDVQHVFDGFVLSHNYICAFC